VCEISLRGGRLQIGMADINSESPADMKSECLADLLWNTHPSISTLYMCAQPRSLWCAGPPQLWCAPPTTCRTAAFSDFPSFGSGAISRVILLLVLAIAISGYPK
jgi:hypothetical protein